MPKKDEFIEIKPDKYLSGLRDRMLQQWVYLTKQKGIEMLQRINVET